jgi:hypothetical protein
MHGSDRRIAREITFQTLGRCRKGQLDFRLTPSCGAPGIFTDMLGTACCDVGVEANELEAQRRLATSKLRRVPESACRTLVHFGVAGPSPVLAKVAANELRCRLNPIVFTPLR